MDEILSATVDSRNGIVLDPRTKLFMLITITTLMFSTSNDGIMNIVKPINQKGYKSSRYGLTVCLPNL